MVMMIVMMVIVMMMMMVVVIILRHLERLLIAVVCPLILGLQLLGRVWNGIQQFCERARRLHACRLSCG